MPSVEVLLLQENNSEAPSRILNKGVSFLFSFCYHDSTLYLLIYLKRNEEKTTLSACYSRVFVLFSVSFMFFEENWLSADCKKWVCESCKLVKFELIWEKLCQLCHRCVFGRCALHCVFSVRKNAWMKLKHENLVSNAGLTSQLIDSWIS